MKNIIQWQWQVKFTTEKNKKLLYPLIFDFIPIICIIDHHNVKEERLKKHQLLVCGQGNLQKQGWELAELHAAETDVSAVNAP